MQDLAQIVSLKLEQSLPHQNLSQYTLLTSFLVEARNTCREKIQEMTAGEIRKIIEHLKSKKVLSPEERDLVRLWMVGDATAYVHAENNYADWIKETNNLRAKIKELAGQMTTPSAYAKLQALLFDLNRTLQGIIAYLQDMDRIERFENSTASLDAKESQALVEILERKLNGQDS